MVLAGRGVSLKPVSMTRCRETPSVRAGDTRDGMLMLLLTSNARGVVGDVQVRLMVLLAAVVTLVSSSSGGAC